MNRILYISLSVILFISCGNKDREILVKDVYKRQTLEAYFQGKKELFEGLAMERLEQEWEVCPVLHVDFSLTKYTAVSYTHLDVYKRQAITVAAFLMFSNWVASSFSIMPWAFFNHSSANITFLLDRNNRVIAIGNPIYNPKVQELYLKIIKGETIERRDESKVIKMCIRDRFPGEKGTFRRAGYGTSGAGMGGLPGAAR